MFKKFTTTKLIIILILLAGLVLFNKFYQSKRVESTFRSEFVNIDTSAVSEINIYPLVEKGKEIKFKRNEKNWELRSGKIKTFADSTSIRYLLSQFVDMKSTSLSGQDKSTWKDLQVTDSTGTKIEIITPTQMYKMVIGKISYNQSTGNGMTNIRHANEEEVYLVPNYLSFAVNQPFSSWRNKTFIKGDMDNWTSVVFTYPADSSIILEKGMSEWLVNGEKADSGKIAQYLGQLSNMQGAGFVDGYAPSSTPVFTVSIKGNNQSSPITIQAYPSDSVQKFILHSSLNPEAYFSESESHLSDKIFVGKNFFLKK